MKRVVFTGTLNNPLILVYRKMFIDMHFNCIFST